jgi:hypothetical protein
MGRLAHGRRSRRIRRELRRFSATVVTDQCAHGNPSGIMSSRRLSFPFGRGLVLATLVAGFVAAPMPGHAGSFVTFESGQVRPLALSPDGTKLFALDTPDDRLEIFDVTASGIVHDGTVPVGMEPVAVAARSNTEVWVVNLLSTA